MNTQSLTDVSLPWLDKIAAACQRMLIDMFDPYQPERHYMRGPGPKWHAKHRRCAARAG